MRINDLYFLAGKFRVVDALTQKVLHEYDGTQPGDIPPDMDMREINLVYAKDDVVIVEVL